MTASSRYFESLPYSISQKTGLVDYDALESQAKLYRPNLIIAGASSYARDWDLQRLRKVAVFKFSRFVYCYPFLLCKKSVLVNLLVHNKLQQREEKRARERGESESRELSREGYEFLYYIIQNK